MKLCSDGYKKDQALSDGKSLLTQHTLELLKTRILHTYLNIQQQKLEISRLAGKIIIFMFTFLNPTFPPIFQSYFPTA